MMEANPTLMRRIKGAMFKLPLMITCEVFEEFIDAYLEGDLPPRQKVIFDMHLMLCRECREYLRAYRASLDLTKGTVEDNRLPDEVPEDLVTAILEARKG